MASERFVYLKKKTAPHAVLGNMHRSWSLGLAFSWTDWGSRPGRMVLDGEFVSGTELGISGRKTVKKLAHAQM